MGKITKVLVIDSDAFVEDNVRNPLPYSKKIGLWANIKFLCALLFKKHF